MGEFIPGVGTPPDYLDRREVRELRHRPTATCDGVPTLGSNPYLEDLYGDSTPHLMCSCERDNAADDL